MIAITKNLSSHSAGNLPVFEMERILTTRSWSQDINSLECIKTWFKEQIMECVLPLHPIIGKLLELYAKCCIPDQNRPYLESIDEKFFQDLFSADFFDNTKLVPRFLSLCYILLYTYALDTRPIPAKFHLGRGLFRYSNELIAKIPIRYLLSQADYRSDDFQPVRHICFKLASFFMPHMLPALVESLEYQHGDLAEIKPFSPIELVSEEQLYAAMKQLLTDPKPFERFIINVNASPMQAQHKHFETISDAMSVTLNPSISKKIVEKVCTIWHRLENIIPRQLYEATFKNWLVDRSLHLDSEILVSKPITLFKVDERVFSSPLHLQCFVNMLSFYLEASRAWYHTNLYRAAIQNSGHPHAENERKERRGLYEAYESAQNSAIVQMLLEICDGEPLEKPHLEEIRRIACAQIHQMFMVNPNLAKLVHFQTYPHHLIPVMVKGVPSAHVVISYIKEMLMAHDLKRRFFAIAMMAELVSKYKVMDSFINLELIARVLNSLLVSAPSESNVQLFLDVLPIFEHFVQTSPFSANSYIELIERVQKFAASRLAIFPSIGMARCTPERRLLDIAELLLNNCRNMNSNNC